MKRFLPGLILGLAVGAAVVRWWPHATPVSAPVSAPAAATQSAGATAGLFVELSAEAVAAAGIETTVPEPITVRDEVMGFAQVLDPTPLLALDRERVAADATLTAARRELTRLRGLHANDRNASARAVELADVEVTRAEAALATVDDALRLNWGVAHDAALMEKLRTGAARLAQVNVVAGERFAVEPATLVLSDDRERMATVLGAAAQADVTLQGRAWLVMVEDAAGLAVGSHLSARVPRGADESPAWLVPTAAVVRHDGRSWIFVPEDDTGFERRLVTLGARRVEGAVVLSGLAAGERVVSVGAQQLLSAGLSGSEGEE